MAPRYLIGDIPADIPAHIGTTDLDIVVGVTLSTDEDEAYRTLQQNLKEAQFAPSRNPDTGQEETFRWGRHVDGVRVQLEFFCPVGTGTAGQLLRNPGRNVGSRIGAVRTRGAELAALDYATVTLAGELLDHAGIQDGVPVSRRKHFRTSEHRGPFQYGRFELAKDDDQQRARLRRFAHGTLAEFLRYWDELNLPS